MDADTTFVISLVLGILSVPAIVSAISDGRTPRVATVVVMLAGGLMVYAINEKEGGYSFGDIPKVIYRVIGDL
jgi:hypothetical protein